jgi:ATP-dependent Clp protease ATP-binding subunit ClpA
MIKDSIIYALDIGSLVAGTKYRGDFEERVKILINNLQQNKNAILFVDEIHTIIGAGSTNMGGIDASNLLKPALARGELRCIGSTTFKEYHNYFEKDQALVRRFQKVVISEPDEESTLKILQGIKSSYEKHHNVEYSESALKAAISLSERYISDRRLPDKAIDLIDEAGARGKMRSNNKAKIIITPEDIEELISSIANIPLIRLESDSVSQLKKLSDNLKNSVFGQDEAVDSLCSSIKLSIAGLRKSNRPTGCYVFAGQTGVGKTELAKQLANLTGMKLLKFDMSEYSEATSATKLIGSAPGYVGFDQGGILTNEVSKYPYAVLLFDEIEKSHPDIFNLFLQVMDEGKLTDNTGKVINFTHTIIIFTTNLVSEVKKNSIGFNDNNFEEKVKLDLSSFNENFSPEFRARLDRVILFNPIDDIVDKIVNKNLKELGALLADKKVRLVIGQGVRQFCAEYCFKKNNNAREIDRVIDALIKQPIADEILFGKLKDGGVVVMDYSKKGGGLSFKFSSAKHIKNEELESDSFFENCP